MTNNETKYFRRGGWIMLIILVGCLLPAFIGVICRYNLKHQARRIENWKYKITQAEYYIESSTRKRAIDDMLDYPTKRGEKHD